MPIHDVFIVMPFSEQAFVTPTGERRFYSEEHFDIVYETLQEAIREHDPSIDAGRTEKRYGNLMDHIIGRIDRAHVVIAVLSGQNPNVFYELGVRHALRNNTLMLVESKDEYPFDLSGEYFHTFSIDYPRDRDALKGYVKERLDRFERETLLDSPVLNALNGAEHEQFRVLRAWETRRAMLVMHGLLNEVSYFFYLVSGCFEFLDRGDWPPVEERPRMPQTWDMIEGFRQNRPMPGLPTAAYSDAEDGYRIWQTMEADWNWSMDRPEPPDAEQLVAGLQLPVLWTAAFLHDLTVASDYIIDNQAAFRIPWLGSAAFVKQLIEGDDMTIEGDEFNPFELAGDVAERADATTNALSQFDSEFTGVPEDVADAAVQSVESTARPFSEIIEASGGVITPLATTPAAVSD